MPRGETGHSKRKNKKMNKLKMKTMVTLLIAIFMISTLAVAIPVSAQNTYTVGTIGPPTYDYATIQEAINAASDGDTILVSAGTYVENVATTKAVKLIGDGSGTTFIAPLSGTVVKLPNWLLTQPPMNGFILQGFTLVTADESHAFLAGSGTPDGTYYTTNLEFDDIVVDGGQRGIGLNAVGGVTFTNVHLSNIKGSPEAALELTGVSDLLFTEGSFEGNAIGVRLQISPGPWGDYGPNDNIQIHTSNFVDNDMAIENQDSIATTTIDAEYNWWGTTDPWKILDKVSGLVDWDPWLDNLYPGGQPMSFGSASMTAGVRMPMVSIVVTPTEVDFDTIIAGRSSTKTVIISNTGETDELVTAELVSDPDGFYEDCLKIDEEYYDYEDWSVTIRYGALSFSETVELTLDVPKGYLPGAYEGTLVFWAEEAP